METSLFSSSCPHSSFSTELQGPPAHRVHLLFLFCLTVHTFPDQLPPIRLSRVTCQNVQAFDNIVLVHFCIMKCLTQANLIIKEFIQLSMEFQSSRLGSTVRSTFGQGDRWHPIIGGACTGPSGHFLNQEAERWVEPGSGFCDNSLLRMTKVWHKIIPSNSCSHCHH